MYHRSPAHHSLADKEAASHEEQTPHKKKLGHPRRVLRLPDLDHAKTAVLNTLLSLDSQRVYRFAMDDFIAWYCSEPRLAFNKTVVLRYKLQLESRHLAFSTINLRLAAVRRLAYEAADTGLLSPELAAGIRRVKGAKRLGVRLGNWLTAREARALLDCADVQTLRGKRSRAILALGLGCGLRRSELAHLTVEQTAKKGGALGRCRPDRQAWAYPNGSRSELGEIICGRLDGGGGNLQRTSLSLCE